LGAQDKRRLAGQPTTNLAAYDAFLRGETLGWTSGTDPQRAKNAIPFYEQAVALGPGFALAWARLSMIRSLLYYNAIPDPELGEAARTAAEAEREFVMQLKDTPDDEQLHVLHGLALAYLERRDEAIREGERAIEIMPVSRDAYTGPYIQHQFVRICIILGECEKAFDLLEPLLKVPYYLSPARLSVDPNFAPLKGSPPFEALVRGNDARSASILRTSATHPSGFELGARLPSPRLSAPCRSVRSTRWDEVNITPQYPKQEQAS
jgi:hypothetical protein